ncbi:MAG: monomethylamine:corrinoid methyltransferase [Chloroflexi bacterium]|nr:monomethylamine:corrinoid methyltransferase [Chloroflexota bacterium]
MTASIEHVLDILDRAHTGRPATVKEWGFELSRVIAQKAKKYGLEKTCGRDNPVNWDDELADRFYQAGLELALEMGELCQDTERVIKITEEDLADAVKDAPAEAQLGKGRDRVVMRHRRPEDPLRPLSASPMGQMVREDLYVALHQGVAQHREIDILRNATPITMFGRQVLAGSPYETAVGRFQARLTSEALWRAGRPGMPVQGVVSSPTVFGQLGSFGLSGSFDPELHYAVILSPGELTTSFHVLHKVIHASNCGARTACGFPCTIGGFVGGPEGAAISYIADVHLQFALHQTDFWNAFICDARYLGNGGREAQWAQSVATQALTRNTHFLGIEVAGQLGGPCTEMLLYECAVSMINLSASGTSCYLGPRTSGTKYANHISPLECKFCAEVLKGAAGLTRRQANDLLNALIPKYEADLYKPHTGKGFDECYDLATLRPSEEWAGIYLKVKKELAGMGVPLALP